MKDAIIKHNYLDVPIATPIPDKKSYENTKEMFDLEKLYRLNLRQIINPCQNLRLVMQMYQRRRNEKV